MAIPSQVVALDAAAGSARVECFGLQREVSLELLAEPVELGDYLLLRAGRYAVERLAPEHALEVLALLEQVLA